MTAANSISLHINGKRKHDEKGKELAGMIEDSTLISSENRKIIKGNATTRLYQFFITFMKHVLL